MSVNNDCVSQSLFAMDRAGRLQFYEPITLLLLRRVPNVTPFPTTLFFTFVGALTPHTASGLLHQPDGRQCMIKSASSSFRIYMHVLHLCIELHPWLGLLHLLPRPSSCHGNNRSK